MMSSLLGDFVDNFGGGGQNNYSLTWSAGNLDIQTATVKTLDAVTAQSNGEYNKLGFSAARLQRVTDYLSFYTAINGQLASKNLDISEKMELGGMGAVRAYPEGETFADQGYVINLETRMQFPKLSETLSGQTQLIGFIDSGTVTENKNPWRWEITAEP